MTEPVRILLVEDVERDAELALYELKRAGLVFQSRRVETESDFRRELSDFKPDVVVSDFSLPRFSGRAALAIARQVEGDIPFIFVSGTIGEDVAVEAMKAGANDYVMKINLARLGPAIQRELREAEGRRKGNVAEAALQQSEVKYRDLIGQASDGIFVTDREVNFSSSTRLLCNAGVQRSRAARAERRGHLPENERAACKHALLIFPKSKADCSSG